MTAGTRPIDGRPRVLLVDDDQSLLAVVARLLGERYSIVTASSAAEALDRATTEGPFAAIVSDYEMPGANGATLLAWLRETAPDMVRILLTGKADLETAIDAVNQGQIFRMLTKPCTPKALFDAVDAACEYYRLVTTERVLLEQTLNKSVKALTDVLSLAQPEAFGRSVRIRRHVADLAARLSVRDAWSIEIAAMLSQVGLAALPSETIERFFRGAPLSASEQSVIARLPETAEQLIADIPRLESVREIVRYQDARFDGAVSPGRQRAGVSGDALPLGARILKIVLDADLLEMRGLSLDNALEEMRRRAGWYDADVLRAFAAQRGVSGSAVNRAEMKLSDVEVGMVFAAEVRAENGMLLVAQGQEVSAGLVDRIQHRWQSFAGGYEVSMLLATDRRSARP